MKSASPLKRAFAWALILSLSGIQSLLVAGASSAESFVPISGAGSTWSQVAVDAWRADVRSKGLVVNFSGTGSTDGRMQYMNDTVDFAVSEIPFENPPEPGQPPEIPDRPYRYLPIVAGGTSFMYNLTVGGNRVRDLRLSGKTLALIFTGQITKWSDPRIKADYGKALPDIRIIPVVRSDGAGASAQFTKYLKSLYPDIWCPFAAKALGQGNRCHHTSFYPTFGSAKGQVGSNGVANYISASYGAGAIGYVEWAYAKRIDFPVVSLLNKAGYYTQPTAPNVAVSLTKAIINKDLTQNLESVYVNPDKRTYPLSSYSYMIIPSTTASPFNANKGRSLSTFINYFLCGGQQKADILGYSPLPKNLVMAGFEQVKAIPGAVTSPSVGACDNPALEILNSAPMPPDCAKQGAVPCTGLGGVQGTAGAGRPASGGASPGGSRASGGSGTSGGSGATAGTSAASGAGGGSSGGSASGGGGAAPAAAAGAATTDPVTGLPTAIDETGAPVAVAAAGAAAVPVAVSARLPSGPQTTVLYLLALAALAAAVVVPPIVLARKRSGS